ncbi:MAG: hypothetical protein KDC66_16755, partial [Phaeodactylibacter sp.]|nr:hypothetical protein [Phaeodactylibacter sp.]
KSRRLRSFVRRTTLLACICALNTSSHYGPPGLNHTGRMFATDITGPPGLALSEYRLPWPALMPGNGPAVPRLKDL